MPADLREDVREDTREEIEMCLNCSKPECDDCLSRGGPFAKPSRAEIRLQKMAAVRRLHALGYTDAKIAAFTGLHISTVAVYRKEMRLPTNGYS